MKGATLKATRERLGILISYSRPSASDGTSDCADIKDTTTTLKLVVTIAGPDRDSHWSEVLSLASTLGVSQLIEYVGPVIGPAKWDLYRSATLFVLPTKSENFGIVIAEALGCGVPVVTTHGAPWYELHSCKCGWWHPVGQKYLDDAVGRAIRTSPVELKEMGRRGMSLISEKYSTAALAPSLRSMYSWVSNAGQKPDFMIE